MEIPQIQSSLESFDPQDRLRAITALRNYDTEVAVPLLVEQTHDPEIIIRSFVAMGLGRKRNAQAFDTLLDLMQRDRDPNVRAEAANSLAMYGQGAIPYLVDAFELNREWVIRISILSALPELDCPPVLLRVCLKGLGDEDATVREIAIAQLSHLANTPQQEAALQLLLLLACSDRWQTRRQVALTLSAFTDLRATDALAELRQDEDHRVVGATLEALMWN
jgi:HEAT repeat protein